MTKHFFIVFAAVGFIFSGCRPGGKNIDSVPAADSITAAIETVTVQKTRVQNELQDPDPTDTIPADRYGINTYSKPTQELVKKKLEEMFNDDLSKNMMLDESRKFIFFEYDLNDDEKRNLCWINMSLPFIFIQEVNYFTIKLKLVEITTG